MRNLLEIRKRAATGTGRLSYQATTRRVQKSQPTASQVHINVPLTNLSVGYMQDPNNFVASRAFGHVPVANQSNVYYKFNKDDFWRDEARPRQGATESAGGGFGLSTDSYGCTPIAYHKDVSDQERVNADSVLQLDSAATRIVSQKMMIRKEKQWVGNFFATGKWGTDMAGVTGAPSTGQFTRWDVNGSTQSDPQADILTGRIKILSTTGYDPRTAVIDPYTYKALQLNTKIQDRFKYTTPESITLGMLAGYFDLDEIFVAMGIESTANEGNATQTQAFIAGKNALLCYKNAAPALMEPSAGYVMTWNAYAGSQAGATITKFRMQHLRADRVEGEFAYDMKLVAADCGYFFGATVS